MKRTLKKKKVMTSAAADRILSDLALGDEPLILDRVYDNLDLIKAYNWYSSKYDVEEMKAFTISYLRKVKFPEDDLVAINRLKASVDFRVIGTNANILAQGGKLPLEVAKRFGKRLYELADKGRHIRESAPESTVDIQKRMREKVSDYVGRIEEELDTFSLEGKNDFDVKDWISKNDIKPLLAKQIANKFKPVYAEMYEASLGKDAELKRAYIHFKKSHMKDYLEFLKGIIAALEGSVINAVKVPRKARKKKIKPAVVVVSKMKYSKEDAALKVKSVNPTSIVGAQQLWVYNSKTRMLGVYKALGPAGLTVKGATIQGFDETISISKKLRKPEVSVPEVVNSGKVAMRQLMDKIRSKSKPLTGRINGDTILLRVL